MNTKPLIFALILSVFASCINTEDKQAQYRDHLFNGSSLMTKKDYSGAIAEFNKAIEVDNSKPEAFHRKGVAKIQLSDFRGAIADFDKAIQLGTKDGFTFYCRGLSHILIGNKELACIDFSKAGDLGYKDAYESIKEYCNQ